MARIETVLADRVGEGLVPRPTSRKITNLRYWRGRRPDQGEINSRQRWKLLDPEKGLWPKLCQCLPEEQRVDRYLCGIASHACGRPINQIWDLRATEADWVIEALKDRLKYALRRAS